MEATIPLFLCPSKTKDLLMSFHPMGLIIGYSLFDAFQIFWGSGCKKVLQKRISFFFVMN
jgi:hypothetical protein